MSIMRDVATIKWGQTLTFFDENRPRCLACHGFDLHLVKAQTLIRGAPGFIRTFFSRCMQRRSVSEFFWTTRKPWHHQRPWTSVIAS